MAVRVIACVKGSTFDAGNAVLAVDMVADDGRTFLTSLDFNPTTKPTVSNANTNILNRVIATALSQWQMTVVASEVVLISGMSA